MRGRASPLWNEHVVGFDRHKKAHKEEERMEALTQQEKEEKGVIKRWREN